MAAYDIFQITVTGRGGHAALPHHTIDPVIVAAQVVTALQSITSRNFDPLESAVITVTQIHGGNSNNVIPDTVWMEGTTRSLKPEIRDRLKPSMERVIAGIATAFGVTVQLDYQRLYPPTINHPPETRIAAKIAIEIAGKNRVDTNTQPTIGAEDFAFMLEQAPGCFLFIGNGAGPGSCMIHNPGYDFNDQILPVGASYFSRLVETVLAI